MGEMRDSDWSRENLLRSDWLVPKGASITTVIFDKLKAFCSRQEEDPFFKFFV